MDDTEKMENRIVKESEKKRVNINSKKTEITVLSKRKSPRFDLEIGISSSN